MVAKRTWSTTFEMRSARFTTRLNEVPMVNAIARQNYNQTQIQP
ncbi:DUF4113 domain-containing protein [Methylobacterium platani]